MKTYYFFILFIISFAVRLFYILYHGFDGFYGQDSYAYYESSGVFLSSVINFQVPHGFYWPIGFYLLTSIFSIITAGNPGVAGLLVSLNAGSLCPPLTFLLAYELFNYLDAGRRKMLSFFSGIIVCFTPILVSSSIVVMSDAAGLLFIISSMLFLIKYGNEPRLKNMLLSFSFFSLALLTRYASALTGAVLAVYLIYISFFEKSAPKRTVLKHAALSALAALVIFLPQLYYIIERGVPYLQFEGDVGTWASSWNPLNFFRSDFTTIDGTMHYKLPNGLYFLSPVFHPAYLSVFGISFLAGVYRLFRDKKFSILLFSLSWFLVYYLYLSGNPFQSLRYTLSFLPPLAVVSGFGIICFLRQGRGNSPAPLLKKGKSTVYVFLSLGILALAGYSFYSISGFMERKEKELEVVSWVDSNIKEGSLLFTFEITAAVNYYSRIKPEEFFLYDEEKLRSKIESAPGDVYFILPIEKLRTQWKSLPIEKSLDFLTTNYMLRHMADVSYYKIFKLEHR